MKYKGLDGKEYTLDKKKYSKQSKNCSALHKEARKIIKSVYPSFLLLEEVRLKGTKTSAKTGDLFADFFLYSIQVMIEVHGIQHYEYNPHFYKTKADFYRAIGRDMKKREFCEINDIVLIELKYNEQDNWREQIEQY